MAEMCITDIAGRFDPGHPMVGISMVRDDGIIDRLGEAGPAGAALKLAGRIEQFRRAAAAGIAPWRKQAAHFA